MEDFDSTGYGRLGDFLKNLHASTTDVPDSEMVIKDKMALNRRRGKRTIHVTYCCQEKFL